jgi:hypothetical protein
MNDDNYDSRRGDFPPPCDVHAWQPVSFLFEHQAISGSGSIDRAPNVDRARVYVVCMQCHRFTYIETVWAGYCLVRPSDQHALAHTKDPAP